MKYNYLEEIKPLFKYVKVFNDNGAHPNQKIKQQLSDIYDRLRESESKFIYGKTNVDIHPIDLGCSTCITNMMRHLLQWHKRISDRDTVEFKGVPQMDTSTKLSEETKKEITEIAHTLNDTKPVKEELTQDKVVGFDKKESVSVDGGKTFKPTNPSQMKWGEFKKHCTSLGLSVKGKKKVTLLEELKGL